MKHRISAILQITVALLITGSVAYAMEPPEVPIVHSQPPPTQPVVAQEAPKPVEVAPTPPPAPTPPVEPPAPPEPPKPVYNGSNQELLAAAGIAPADFEAADFIIMREGIYNPCIINGGAVDCSYAVNGGQKAYGVCQALPGSKMASAGADWATNPVTQLRWCASYSAKYGGWQGSRSFWLANRYW